MFGFLQGYAFQRQLHEIPIGLLVSPSGALATGTALHQTGIFDAVPEPICDHLIPPINEGWQVVLLPDQVACIALFWLLQHETQTGVVALVLDAVESAVFALKACAARFSYADAIDGTIGACRQRLSQYRIQMVS
jgi:hypothetical protein